MKNFSPQQLLEVLSEYPDIHRYWVAYSGGLDSHVLLHSLAVIRLQLSAKIQVVHINHGLSEDAEAWSEHCCLVCSELDIPYQIISVDATPKPGDSPEAAARQARYAALEQIININDGLLTAHHQDDQSETVLLQLLRGTGPHGLAAMPATAPFSDGSLIRPLLGYTRLQLQDYAKQQGLNWIVDPTNFDTGFKRNFLRHEVIPQLKSHWPGMSKTLSRTASHCAEAAQIVDISAEALYQHVKGTSAVSIAISQLCELDRIHQRNVLRYWFRHLDLALPEAIHLEHILTDLIEADVDREPLISWPGVEVRRYRDLIYAMKPLEFPDSNLILQWDIKQTLDLPYSDSKLWGRSATGDGIDYSLCQSQAVTVRFRQGGERCKPSGDRHTRSLKKLYQDRGVPPWQRDRIPMIYIGEDLAAVPGYWVCQPYQAAADRPGVVAEWSTSG